MEKSGGDVDGEDEYGDAVADDEDSLLVKKEAKLLASEVAELLSLIHI